MNRSDYELIAEDMEEKHLSWVLKYRPTPITREDLDKYPKERLWAFGVLVEGFYIFEIDQLEYMSLVEGIYATEQQRTSAEREWIQYKFEVPCYDCNVDYDDDSEENSDNSDNSDNSASCEVCSGEGWIHFDCIGDPVCAAVQSALDDGEWDDQELSSDELEYLRKLTT